MPSVKQKSTLQYIRENLIPYNGKSAIEQAKHDAKLNIEIRTHYIYKKYI